jgi:hypothetical protein
MVPRLSKMEGERAGVRGSGIPPDAILGVPLSIRMGMGNVGFSCLLRRNFVKAGGFGIPLFDRARVREVRGFVIRLGPSFWVPLFVQMDTIQV